MQFSRLGRHSSSESKLWIPAVMCSSVEQLGWAVHCAYALCMSRNERNTILFGMIFFILKEFSCIHVVILNSLLKFSHLSLVYLNKNVGKL